MKLAIPAACLSFALASAAGAAPGAGRTWLPG